MLLTFVFGRLYGAEGAGILFLGVTVVLIGSTFGRLGMEYTLLKLAAQAYGRQRRDQFWGVAWVVMRTALIASSLTSILLAGGGWGLMSVVEMDVRLFKVVPWFLGALPIFSLVVLVGDSLKSCDRPGLGTMTQTAFVPLMVSALSLLTFGLGWTGVEWGGVSYFVSSLIALIVGGIGLRLAVPQPEKLEPPSRDELWKPMRSLLWFSLLSILNNWIPLLVISFVLTSDDWGRYGAATRLATAVSFILWASNSVVPPRYARLYEKRDWQGMQRLARRASMVMTVAAAIPVLFLAGAGGWLLGWMGEEFPPAATALTILAFGQWLTVAAGSVDYLLVVSGHEVELRRGAMLSATTNLLLCMAMIPSLGITGGAIAGAISLCVERVWYCFSAWRYTGIVTLPVPIKLCNSEFI